MMQVQVVALGGAAGSVARHGVGFPWRAPRLVVGPPGARVGPENPDPRLALGIGVLGGFTTFSTFSLETVRLMQHQSVMAALYVVASAALGVGACWAGFLVRI